MAEQPPGAWDVPVVDCHVHVFARDLPLVANPHYRPSYDFTPQHLLATLDQHGVSFAVIAAISILGDYNDYTLAALRRHPRLRGTVILPPTTEPRVLEDMKRDGIVGVRLSLFNAAQMPDLGGQDYRRFLKRIADLDWHVHVHAEGEQLPRVLPALEASGVKIVVDHIGRPDPKTGVRSAGFQSLLRSVQSGRTWVKLSGAYRVGTSALECGQALVREAGPDRLVWASDCPFVQEEGNVTYRETIAWLRDCVPDAAARRRIGCETALKLYFF